MLIYNDSDRLVPVALVPRPWDFSPAPVMVVQPAPAQDPAQQEPTQPTDPASPPQSPSLPPSRPASPPSLLPPLAIHEAGFGDAHDEPNKSAPADETPVEADDATITQTNIPAVSVVPPTPTASIIKASESTISQLRGYPNGRQGIETHGRELRGRANRNIKRCTDGVDDVLQKL